MHLYLVSTSMQGWEHFDIIKYKQIPLCINVISNEQVGKHVSHYSQLQLPYYLNLTIETRQTSQRRQSNIIANVFRRRESKLREFYHIEIIVVDKYLPVSNLAIGLWPSQL